MLPRRSFLAAVAAVIPAGAHTSAAPKSGYAAVNGLKLYYEIHGVGKPFILLHSGLGATAMFGPILPLLANGRQVVAIDLQGQGRTADIDRPPGHSAGPDSLRDLLVTHPANRSYALSRSTQSESE